MSMSHISQHTLTRWQLTDPQPLATTTTSHVYTVTHAGERVVLKLLTPQGSEERQGAVALRHFDGQGAVRLLQYGETAHLLEYADGADVTSLVARGDDAGATRVLGEVLNALHTIPAAPPDGLTPLTVWFRALFRQAAQDTDALITRGAYIAQRLLHAPQEVRVLHGDMHHENVRWKDGRGWLAFDPKGLIGERTFDCANILRNPHTRPDLVYDEARMLRTAERLEDTMHVDVGRLLAFTFALACLSACWYREDGGDDRGDVRLATLLARHVPETF